MNFLEDTITDSKIEIVESKRVNIVDLSVVRGETLPPHPHVNEWTFLFVVDAFQEFENRHLQHSRILTQNCPNFTGQPSSHIDSRYLSRVAYVDRPQRVPTPLARQLRTGLELPQS